MNTLGLHLLLEMQNCDAALLNDIKKLRRIFYSIARKSGMTPLKDVFHAFTPHGISGVLLLAESHASIHSWPELGYAAVDFFSCNLETDLQEVTDLFVATFKPTSYDSSIHYRGEQVHTPHIIEKA